MIIDAELLELEKKANVENPEALNDMAYHYEYGLGVEQNIIKAYRYYLKSASLGNIDAILQVCDFYYDKSDRTIRYLYWNEKAFIHPKITGEQKGQCAVNISAIYEEKEEHDKVLHWVEKALEFGKELPQEDVDYVKFMAEHTKNKILAFKSLNK